MRTATEMMLEVRPPRDAREFAERHRAFMRDSQYIRDWMANVASLSLRVPCFIRHQDGRLEALATAYSPEIQVLLNRGQDMLIELAQKYGLHITPIPDFHPAVRQVPNNCLKRGQGENASR